MKTLRSIALSLALLAVNNIPKAHADPDYKKLTKNYAVSTYVDAIAHGEIKGLRDVLNSGIKFSLVRGKALKNFTKDEIMAYFAANENLEMKCTTSSTTIESNDGLAVVKVDMHFDDFLRSDYLIITNSDKGWTITNIYSVFRGSFV
jgi:hypothetical protein